MANLKKTSTPKTWMDSQDKKDIIMYHEEFKPIKDLVEVIRTEGAYDDMVSSRSRYETLEYHYNNVFSGDLALNSSTTRTDLYKSFLCRVQVELYRRKMSDPVFDIESVNRSKTAYDQKTKASIVKSLYEWASRVSGYEDVSRNVREDQLVLGDGLLTWVVDSTDDGQSIPVTRQIRPDNALFDQNSNSMTTEDPSEKGYYFGFSEILSKQSVSAEYGNWIFDFIVPGGIIDSDTVKKNNGMNTSKEYYERLWLFDIGTGTWYIGLGGNGFPVVWMSNLGKLDVPEMAKYVNKQEYNIVWKDKYPFINTYGKKTIPVGQRVCFFDRRRPRNWGVVDKTFVLQVEHEIVENLKIDNMIKRLDQITVMQGGNHQTDKQLNIYRKEKKINRYAVWNLPGGLEGKMPEPKVIKFEGLTAQEGTETTENIMRLAKNATGVDPQQLEVQRNTAVTQTQIIEEKSVEAVEQIMEDNLSGMRKEITDFIEFLVNFKDSWSKDTLINFIKYDKYTPEGNRNAQIGIQQACDMIKDFQYDVIIDQSKLVKRSRYLERQQLLDFLQYINPASTPEWFMAITQHIAEISGISLPDVRKEDVQSMEPMGGNSQFQTDSNASAGMRMAEGGQQGGLATPEPQLA